MAEFIASRADQTVEVEPHVSQVFVRIAGLTIAVQRSGSDDEPTISIDAWDDDFGKAGSPVATMHVPAPADRDRDPAVLEWYRQRAT
jgi:hypothetical protein